MVNSLNTPPLVGNRTLSDPIIRQRAYLDQLKAECKALTEAGDGEAMADYAEAIASAKNYLDYLEGDY